MAATLTDSGELTYTSFGIERMETNDDGDIIVYGKCSDGEVDSDAQIVSPDWMASASKSWLASGANLRVQHNAQRDPAGIGLEISTDASGATWLKGLVVEPVAKRLVAKGALRAFSVGIARPTIVNDVTGKARGGIIRDGELVEVSLVDRPANSRCRFQLAKSAANGHAEYVGKVFGSDDDIAKMLKADDADKKVSQGLADMRETLNETMRAQSADPDNQTDPRDVKVWGHLEDLQGLLTEAERDQNMDVDKAFAGKSEDMSLTFTPTDLAKILKNKIIDQHYEELALKAVADGEYEILGKDHREFSAEERRRHASAGNALSDGSYPIPDKDALRRAAILARSKHGNWQAAARLIARRARELGVPNPMHSSDSDSSSKGMSVPGAPAEESFQHYDKGSELPAAVTAVKNEEGAPEAVATPEAVKEAEPVITKEPEDAAAAKPKAKKPKKGKKTLPPWLQDTQKADRPKADRPKADSDMDDDDGDGDESDDACKLQHVHTEKCMPSGTPQSASGASDAPAMAEMPDPGAYQHTPMPAGRATPEHKAYASSPEAAAVLRFKTIGMDTDLGRLHDLTCPAFHPDDVARYHPFSSLKSVIDTGVWQRRAVDAACGPLEKAMAMTQVWQAAETLKSADEAELNDYRLSLHKAFRDANPGPTTYPSPGAVSPSSFKRPVITAGHASNSSGYGAPNTSPSVASGMPSAHSFDRPPLASGHQTPSPSFMKGGFEYPSETGVPQRLQFAALEKERARAALDTMHEHLSRMFPTACPMEAQQPHRVDATPPVPPTAGIGKSAQPEAVFKAPLEDVDETIYKAFKKMRKKLGKKVLSGKMTVDEARSQLGRNFAQKDEEPQVEKAVGAVGQGLQTIAEAREEVPAYKGTDPDLIKSAVAEAVSPLVEQLTKAQTRIEEQQAALDAIANLPDPSTAAFTGLALNPVRKSARPAGVPTQAEVAERTQQMIMRQLERTYRSSDNPAEREAARSALDKFQGIL